MGHGEWKSAGKNAAAQENPALLVSGLLLLVASESQQSMYSWVGVICFAIMQQDGFWRDLDRCS